MQVPEGFYHISHFNPSSQFYLSLKVNYPNASDRKRSAAPALGGDIYLHGHCVSVGCLAMTDPAIKELYWLLVLAKEAGQGQVPCHIFPVRLTPAKRGLLRKLYADEPELLAFWAPLGQAYAYFEEHRRLPRVNIHAQGHYVVE
jgi:murein L,D-transpeptidase YafK